MKALFYCSKFPPLAGGAGINALYMAEHMTANGHEVFVVCEGQHGLPAREQLNERLRVHRVRVPIIRDHASGFYFLLLCIGIGVKGLLVAGRHRPSVLHLWDTATGIAGIITKALMNIPSVYLFGGSLAYEYLSNSSGPEKRQNLSLGEGHVWRNSRGIISLALAIEKRFFLRNDRVYACARYLVELVKSHSGADSPDVRYIPNGVDTTQLSRDRVPDIRARFAEPHIIFAGVRLVKYKGLDTLINACLPILEPYAAVLLIAGSGPEEDRLKAIAGDNQRVRFLGNLSWEANVAHVRAADVWALPTLVDKTPNCVLEALALETPVVTTDIPGVRELIPENGGLLVRPDNPNELRKLITWVLDNPREATEMAKKGREYVVENFDWKKTCSNIETLYRELLHEGDEL